MSSSKTTKPKREGFSYNERAGHSIGVLFDGRVIGHILRKSAGGFVYAPKGSTLRGDTFDTVAQVKRSIEGDFA